MMDIEHQLKSTLELLESVKWLYDFPVTQLFSSGVLDLIPSEWKEVLSSLSLDELNGLPQCQAKEHWPKSLQHFLSQCKVLSLFEFITLQNEPMVQKIENLPEVPLPGELLKGMSAKKKHEVCRLTALVKATAPQCQHVLDFGSGKGYIDTALHTAFGLNVLGAESEAGRVSGAEERQATLLAKHCQGIEHINWILEDNEETIKEGEKIIRDFSRKSVCPIGKCLRNSYRTNMSKNNFDQGRKYFRNESFAGKDEACISSNDTVKNIADGIDFLNIETTNNSKINSTNLMKYKDKITKENYGSLEELNSTIVDKTIGNRQIFEGSSENPNRPVMLLGLHACADLSPIIMKLFSQSDSASHMILLSCCYHKLKINPLQENLIGYNSEPKLLSEPSISKSEIKLHQEYLNFPMSTTLHTLMSNKNIHLSVYGLRLAAQESGLRWDNQTEEQHLKHANNVIFRAILEDYCQQGNFKLKKLKRKCANKSKYDGFDEYVETILLNHEITMDHSSPNKTMQNPSHEEIISGLHSRFECHKSLFPLVEPITGLQLALQQVLESLVLLDRVLWLRESQVNKVWLQPIFDPQLSPRCVALCAVK